MRTITCNVIRDLMPSYMDEICSEDSRLLVEEHINGCEQCRQRLELLKKTQLSDEKGEQKRISFMRKIKRRYTNKGIVSLIFFILLMAGGLPFMVRHSDESTLFYIFFPLLIMAAYCLMPDNPPSAKTSGLPRLLFMMSALMIIYFTVMVYWGMQINRNGDGLFDIPLDEIGYFMQRRLVFIIVVQLGIFILSNILIICGFHVNKCIYGLSLTGMYLAVGYIRLLYNLSTFEEFYGSLLKINGYIILEGVVFSTTSYSFAKKMMN